MINTSSKYIAVDCETTGLNPWDRKYPARAFAFSFYDSKGNSEYLRLDVDPFTRQPKIGYSGKSIAVRIRVNQIMKSSSEKIFHNANFDIRMLNLFNVFTPEKYHDTQLLMHIVTGGNELSYGLKPLAKKYLDIKEDDLEDLKEAVRKARREAKKKGWTLAEDIEADYWMAPDKLCERYAVLDAKRTMLLFLSGKEQLTETLLDVYKRELLLSPLVRRMEDRGVRVFNKEIKNLTVFYEDHKKKQLEIADKNGGKGLNFKSPVQLVNIFYKKKKLPIMSWTKKGNPSVDGKVLLSLSKKDPLAKAILEYKAASHAISSFLEPYNRFKSYEDGCWVLHPGYRQCGTRTARFGCSDPNLMQVAAPDAVKNKADISLRPREVFGPRKGHLWYLPDFSQMEVWVFAFLAKERIMMDTLLSGKDIHGAMAEKVWGHQNDFKEKYSVHRARAKFMTWCKLYGGGVNAISEQLDIDQNTAKQYSDEYDAGFPELKSFLNRTANLADREGFVENIYGRRYNIDPGYGYKSVNYLVQGGCADIMKIAMLRVDKFLKQSNSKSKILLTLHDELVIEVPFEEDGKPFMRQIMLNMQEGHSDVLEIPVPLPVDMSIVTKRWNNPAELCRKHLNNKKECEKCNVK